jgi:hypothetical protein
LVKAFRVQHHFIARRVGRSAGSAHPASLRDEAIEYFPCLFVSKMERDRTIGAKGETPDTPNSHRFFLGRLKRLS